MRHSIRSLAFGVAALFAAGAQAQTTNLKMQATWPASLTLYENFTYFVERVGKMSGGQLRIDAMPAGPGVPALDVVDSTHKKGLPGSHSWAGFLVGKNKYSSLITHGACGPPRKGT